MEKVKRGPDAADRQPQDKSHSAPAHPVDPGEEQDAPNYDATIDDGQAIKSGDVSSANDE